jgi:1,4-alpha-glucan branching enzyme
MSRAVKDKTGSSKKIAAKKDARVDGEPQQQKDRVFHSLTDFDTALFSAGRHFRSYEKLGSHLATVDGQAGTWFAVWAPNARYVSVVGNFNGWNRGANAMNVRWDGSGIWELFIPHIGKGEYYKYFIEGNNGYQVEKPDPYAIHFETPPATASIVWEPGFEWTDEKWMRERQSGPVQQKPVSVYEVHLGSWRRKPEQNNRSLSYREMAEELPGYCKYMGFTHVELLPVMEHPFYGSWGYQVTGYYAPTSRYGTPEDFMFLVNALHEAGIGVILDWVPSHFPTDEHGPGYFDGTHLFEHSDPRKGFHQDWGSLIFNYGRNEVRSFLISNALYWLDKYHIDGLRVDAVASMLYLDYSRKHGEWEPNQYGGRENLEAVHFLKEFNDAVHEHHPGTFTVAEESTSWPGVTNSTSQGGLGFDMKWMMGWMHDTLYYFQKDPIHRSYHHGMLAFSLYYAFSEKFMLPLSHDEVVHGKGSLINKMPGDGWQQFANLRLLFGYMYGHPGTKLLFMGSEFAQRHEWRHDQSLDWDENNHYLHNGVQLLLKDLNELYTSSPCMHMHNFSPEGFEWIDFNDHTNSVIAWVRKTAGCEPLVFVANFTPGVLLNYRIGVPGMGNYREILNTDDTKFGGSGKVDHEVKETAPIPKHGRTHSISLTLPPLGVAVLKKER